MLQKNWEKLGLLINLNIIDTNKQNLGKKRLKLSITKFQKDNELRNATDLITKTDFSAKITEYDLTDFDKKVIFTQ